MRKKLAILIASVLASLVLVGCGGGDGGGNITPTPTPPQPPAPTDPSPALPDYYDTMEIKKTKGEDFNILIFADIQLDARTNGGVQQTMNNCFPLMDKLVEDTKPDYIILVGDNEGNYTRNDEEKAQAETLYSEMIKKLDSYKIPYSPIFGNHERDTYTLEWQAQQFVNAREDKGYCYFEDDVVFREGQGVNELRGNYTVSLTEGENDNILYSFVFTDSGDLNGSMDSEAQFAWYEEHIKKISTKQYGEYDVENNKVVPSMLFLHRALPEFNDAGKLGTGNADGKGQVLEQYGKGYNYEEQYDNRMGENNLFDLIKELQSTTLVACGHRHNNNSVIKYEGVDLMFSTKTGINNGHDKRLIGGTVITVKDEKDENGRNLVEYTLYDDYYEKVFK